MVAFLVIAAAAYVLLHLLGGAPMLRIDRRHPKQVASSKIVELSQYADRLRQANKYLAAEKAYLQILKIDHKHVPTYSRLGTLYIALKNFGDAIECLQIASQLSPSATTHYNLGLGYYENRNYIKAIAAFEKATMFEPSAQRYIGLAKSYQRLEHNDKVVTALEQAVDLDETPRTLWLLHDALQKVERDEEAEVIKQRIRKLDPKDPKLIQHLKSPLETAV